jgi:hypothetical protein
MNAELDETTITFAERLKRFDHERKAVKNLLRIEGPYLINQLVVKFGSLRKLSNVSGLSASYLSLVANNQREPISIQAYLRLDECMGYNQRK